MFRTVLVGVDGHRGGRDALALAGQLLEPDGKLTLANVYPGDSRLRHASPHEHERVAQKRAFAILTEARDQAGVFADLLSVESPSPGRGLHELAESIGADLVVVGSSRRGGLGRVLIGDDTHAALNGARCAVAIAPSGYSNKLVPIRKIGVAYNGSHESAHAVDVARVLAAEHGARLSACEAIALPVYAFVGGPVPVNGAIDDLLIQAREQIEALGDIEPHATYGNVVDDLSAYSASVDLLIAGSRGYGPLGRLVHGSTSSRLARAVRCPLLVLTRLGGDQESESRSGLAPSETSHARSV
jgi:nucleotide-binding universal stress UspA family protein